MNNQQKKIVPEIEITQLQQQQQQQQQHEQQKKEILEAGKMPESYEKRVAHPFEQKPEINNEVVTPLPPLHLLLLQLPVQLLHLNLLLLLRLQ